MMRAKIADIIQTRQPALQHFGRKSKQTAKLFLLRQIQKAKKGEQRSKACNFRCHPKRQSRFTGILRKKMAYERFAASFRFMVNVIHHCLLYTSPSPRDRQKTRMPSSA